MEGSVDNDKKKNEGKGGMWALQHKFDQPMDEEASKLKNMYTERVRYHFLLFIFLFKKKKLHFDICCCSMNNNKH
ncbi:hypothetical protein HanPSC8_Chr09g0375841 [Helianthus annuus]|nr:hypothetical protein HanPSC8_Chr09g0375841 [Helianthus annuus]